MGGKSNKMKRESSPKRRAGGRIFLFGERFVHGTYKDIIFCKKLAMMHAARLVFWGYALYNLEKLCYTLQDFTEGRKRGIPWQKRNGAFPMTDIASV